MKEPMPRWIALMSALITVIVGMLGFAAFANGWMVYQMPHAIRDGQYMMGVAMFGAAGFWGGLPVAVLSGILVYRDTRFFLPHALALGGAGALAIGVGILLSGLSAGWEGILAALLGLVASPLWLIAAPILLLDPSTYLNAAPASACLALIVVIAYLVHRRRCR